VSSRDAIVAEIPRLRRYARALTGRGDTGWRLPGDRATCHCAVSVVESVRARGGDHGVARCGAWWAGV